MMALTCASDWHGDESGNNIASTLKAKKKITMKRKYLIPLTSHDHVLEK